MPVNIRKLATIMAGGSLVGSQNMGGASYGGASHGPPTPGPSTVSAGAASIPGKSVHCLKCGAKLKPGASECPKCGSDVRRVAEAESGSSADQQGETGADAAVRDAQEDGDYADEGKYASSRTLGAASEIARNMAGGAAVVGGLELARRFSRPTHKRMKEEARLEEERKRMGYPQQYTSARTLHSAIRKAASARTCNPVINLRRGAPSTVKGGLKDANKRVARLKEALARKGY